MDIMVNTKTRIYNEIANHFANTLIHLVVNGFYKYQDTLVK